MLASGISSSHRLSEAFTQRSSLIGEPAQQTPDTSELSGERRLLASYAAAIRQEAQEPTGARTIDDIPRDSRFGQWWQHLFNATHSPMFLAWAKLKNIDISQGITVDHHADTLTVTINGRRTRLVGAEQGRDWREMTAPLMAAAKAMGGPPFEVPTNPLVAPLMQVARFYGEILLPDRKDETLARATQLEQNHAFDVLGAGTYVDVGSQSPEIQHQQQRELGDSTNKYTLLQTLKAFSTSSQKNLTEYLETRIPTHPDSSYRRSAENGIDASLKDLISAGGWHLPKSVDELNNLIQALAAPSLPEPVDGDFSGALAWSLPMSIEDQSEIFRIIADNQPPLPSLDSDARLGSADVLGALVKHVPRTVIDKNDPLATLQWILDSAPGEALGKALKNRMGDVFKYSTPREVLLTALGITLDLEGLDDPKPHHIAGFNLAAPELHLQPFSVIRERLIAHLVSQKRVTPEAAPVAALLLLSRAAPELCISDTPANLTYMSANWVRLKSAVERIEATSPGASSRMSVSEIFEFDAIDPVTDHEEEVHALTAAPGLMLWGQANGIIPAHGEVSTEQLVETQKAFNQQQQQILSASAGLTDAPPTLRAVALAELKAHFGDAVPFEEKSIRSNVTKTDSFKLTPSITLDPTGSYSLLDLYLSKKAGIEVGWSSPNPKITEAIINKITTLPDPIAKHSEQFDRFANGLSQGWDTLTRKLISDLPLEDRKNIEWGDIAIFQRGHVSQTLVSTPHGDTQYSHGFSSSADDRSLIVETLRNGIKTCYEFDPQRKVLRRRDDWQGAVREGPQGQTVESSLGVYGRTFTTPAIRKLDADADISNRQGREDDTVLLPNSFSSSRSTYLGKLLSDNILAQYPMADLKASLGEATTFDKEEAQRTFARNMILGLIPGGSAIWNLAQGNYLEAGADVIFDLVTYATTKGLGKGFAGIKGVKSVKELPKRSGLSLTASALTRGLQKGVGSSVRKGKALLSNGPEWVGKLTGSSDSANLVKLSNQPDIAVGTYKASDSSPVTTVVAKFDETTSKWLPYDTVKNKPYGKPLENFTPETARYFEGALGAADEFGVVVRRRPKPNHLEKSLATDNAMRFGNDLKDFKPLGEGIFIYVDKYKGVERLNVCAHGVDPNFKQLLTDEPMKMFYNGKSHTPDELLSFLREAGVDPQSFNNVRLLMCHSANGSVNSFGSQFGKLINRDVKAFQGPVRAHVVPEDVDKLKVDLNTAHPQSSADVITQQIYNRLKFNLALGTNKVGPNKLGGSSSGVEIPFFYRPVKFKAS
ncbi:hypothetical protein ABVN22_18545 [Pseudomonas poae]|nr:hypothetical protein [Pseudomonas poae]